MESVLRLVEISVENESWDFSWEAYAGREVRADCERCTRRDVADAAAVAMRSNWTESLS